jgi:type VI secretion system protein ImpJ
MSFLSRVVWSEGMYIGPHHFQAQSRYFEDSAQFVAASLRRDYYGFLGCEMDSEALRNGTLAVVHARGIFPDGLLFKMPEADALPPPRTIGDLFPSDRDKLTVYLSISARKPNGVNCALTETAANGARFTAQTSTVTDEVNGLDEKPLRLGRKNITLALETELNAQSVTLPIARIMRSGAGRYIFDPAFIPPSLEMSASPRLMSLTQRLIEILEDKSSTLARSHASNSGKTGYATGEIAGFWFLHAVNSGMAPLRHMFYSTHGHPEELYLELARLAGALCTFTLEVHPRSIPPYDHLQPDKCFDALDKLIRLLLETVLPTNCISIPLIPAGDYLHNGTVTDQRCLGRSSWVFAVRANMGAAEVMRKTPELIKICSEEFVKKLVARALPGLTLTHMPLPPRAIAAQVETQYFLVTKTGPCWDHLVATRRVGVYVPGEFGENPSIELLVVLDG